VKPFRFCGPDVRSFKLVVFARRLRDAREYVKREAIGSKAHRVLKYAGEGNPDNPEMWCAAAVTYGG
jgi:hypothetical protein